MPIFEYRCEEGHQFEKLVPSSQDENEPVPCKECGEEAKRILSPSNFVLKGNWFKNKGRY